jgi:hypothetical protein
MTIAKTSSQRFFFLASALILFLACFYVFQIVKLTEMNYLVGQKESQEKELKKETAQLELSVSRSSNLTNFESKITEEGYQKISSINYIVVSEAAVASAK